MRRPRTSENSPSRERESQTQSVVATDTASVDADYDNGAVVRGTPRCGGCDERAACRVVRYSDPENASTAKAPPEDTGAKPGPRVLHAGQGTPLRRYTPHDKLGEQLCTTPTGLEPAPFRATPAILRARGRPTLLN